MAPLPWLAGLSAFRRLAAGRACQLAGEAPGLGCSQEVERVEGEAKMPMDYLPASPPALV